MDKRSTELCEELRRDPDARHLADTMLLVESHVARWWAQAHMVWFTDHGADHSRRVAERVLELADNVGRGILPKKRLKPLEKYLLWAAAMLHDIGMQDMRTSSAKPLGSMSEEDFAEVRRLHSQRSAELMIAQPAAFGLPDDDPSLVDIVASLAKAHSTSFYAGVINHPDLRSPTTHVRGDEVRAKLLAALLLFADELDLDSRRVNPLPGRLILPPVSEAHRFKHQCIDGCKVTIDDRSRIQLDLSLTFPERLPDVDRQMVERWIVDKLQQQMGMIEPQIEEGFGGSVGMNKSIGVTRKLRENRMPPSNAALAVIRAEATTSGLINYRPELSSALDMIEAGSTLILVGEMLKPDWIDLHGREDLFAAVVAQLECRDRIQIWNAVNLHENLAVQVEDLLRAWLVEAGQAVSLDLGREDLLAKLLVCLSESDEAVVLAASTLEALDGDLKYLAEMVLPEIRKAAPGTSFVFTGSSVESHCFENRAEVIDLTRVVLPPGDVGLYLSRVMSRESADAAAPPRNQYSGHKGLYQQLQKSLERNGHG